MYTSTVLLSLLAGCGVCAATPTTPPPKYYSNEQFARFDNEQGTVPVVPLQSVGIYFDIKYNGFVGSSQTVPALAGLKAQSPPNQIGFGQIVTSTILEGQPSMTVVYQDTTIDFFDLKSLYFGCVSSLKSSEANLPVAATLTLECIDPQGKTVKKQDFRFEKNGGLVQEMVQAKPTGFKGCQKVNFFSRADDPLFQTSLATGVDTIDYIVYSSKRKFAV